MNDFLDKVSTYIEKYHMLSAGDTVAAGVSGGADSVCLLFVLSALQKKIPFRLMVVHVNHKIRNEAGEDAAYVQKLCESLQVPFSLYEKDVEQIARREGISTEEAGRNIRYEAFREVLTKCASAESKVPEAEVMEIGKTPKTETMEAGKLPEVAGTEMRAMPETGTLSRNVGGHLKIAVAHHKNDRAETVLFHLFRGTGPVGLEGIRPTREDKDGIEVIRPLLDVSRTEIEAYLKELQVGWCEDATNGEDDYCRNRIRHNILPYAEEQIAPGAVGNICRTADLLLEMNDFAGQEMKKAWQDCARENGAAEEKSICFDCEKFSRYHSFLQKNMLLYALEQLTPHRKDMGAVHVDYLLSLFQRPVNREISLPYGLIAGREYDSVVLRNGKNTGIQTYAGMQPGTSVPVDLPKPGEGEKEVFLPDGNSVIFSIINCEKSINIPQNRYTKWFDYDKIEKSLVLRTRQKGDFLTIDDRFSRKSIQDYMVNEKIPRAIREEMPLLCEENHVLWVPGYRISSFYKINENTKYILQVQLRGGQIDVGTY